MANPASMAMWLSSCARSLAIYGGLVRMHTVAARPARYIPPDVITAALEPESLDLYEERLAEMQRTDLEDRFSRHASVLLPLCHDGRTGEPSVLFTLRASSLRAHSGEVSFPGGKRDTDDAHAEACALRECMEEVGLAPERMLGRWHDITNKEGTAAVTPCIAYLGTIDVDAINSNPDEVEEVFLVPLQRLADPELRSHWSSRRFPGVKMPQFDGGPHRIWGLTAYILAGFLNTIVFPPTPGKL